MVLLLGLFVGVVYQAAPLRTGTDIICQNRTETLPPGYEDSPYPSFRGSSYRILPAELTCQWQVDGRHVVTRIGMNPGADLIAGLLLGAGAVLLVLPGPARRKRAPSAEGPPSAARGLPAADSPLDHGDRSVTHRHDRRDQ